MPDSLSPTAPARSHRIRPRLRRLAVLVAVGVVMGQAYDWASGRLYRAGSPPGLGLGVVHGALMPLALPTLLLGRDVPIFAPGPTGRVYKIGYIAGINLCGLVFFGAVFRRSGRSAGSGRPFGGGSPGP